MIRQEEHIAKPNLRQGIFSRIDTTRPGRIEEKSLTPRKRPIRTSLDTEADKENDQNIVNKDGAKHKQEQKGIRPDASVKSLGKKLPSTDYLHTRSGLSIKANIEPPQKALSRDISVAQKIKEETPSQYKEDLEREKKTIIELKKRLNYEKTIAHSLKSKVKQLEDEKARIEENHRKSLVNIETRVSSLKNTNLLLLNKAQKYESFTKQLEEVKEEKITVNDTLK